MSNGMRSCAQGVRGAVIKLQPVVAFCHKAFVLLSGHVLTQRPMPTLKSWGKRQDLLLRVGQKARPVEQKARLDPYCSSYCSYCSDNKIRGHAKRQDQVLSLVACWLLHFALFSGTAHASVVGPIGWMEYWNHNPVPVSFVSADAACKSIISTYRAVLLGEQTGSAMRYTSQWCLKYGPGARKYVCVAPNGSPQPYRFTEGNVCADPFCSIGLQGNFPNARCASCPEGMIEISGVCKAPCPDGTYTAAGQCLHRSADNGDPGCLGTGNPVHTATGNKYWAEVDIVETGFNGLRLARYYNSYKAVCVKLCKFVIR